jgi:hypothetical protein
MQALPANPNLDHLKKQAKDLLRQYRNGDAPAIARLSSNLPALSNRSPDEVRDAQLALHDAQSCIAREYGFVSWPELVAFVEARSFARQDHLQRVERWLSMAYGGDVTGSFNLAHPRVAARLLHDVPDAFAKDISVACAIGDVAALRAVISADPQWVHRPIGPWSSAARCRDAFPTDVTARVQRAAAPKCSPPAGRRRESGPVDRQSFPAGFRAGTGREGEAQRAVWRRWRQPGCCDE